MKKKYINPTIEIIDIKANQQLLTGSLPWGSGDVAPGSADAPDFYFDDDD